MLFIKPADIVNTLIFSDPEFSEDPVLAERVLREFGVEVYEVMSSRLDESVDWVQLIDMKLVVLMHLEDVGWIGRMVNAMRSMLGRSPSLNDYEAEKRRELSHTIAHYLELRIRAENYEFSPEKQLEVLSNEFPDDAGELCDKILFGAITVRELLVLSPGFLLNFVAPEEGN